jgi:hypothetical protein
MSNIDSAFRDCIEIAETANNLILESKTPLRFSRMLQLTVATCTNASENLLYKNKMTKEELAEVGKCYSLAGVIPYVIAANAK